MPSRLWNSSKRLTPKNASADDQHGPPFPDHLEALGHRAVHVGETLAFHTSRIVGCIMKRNHLKWVL